jgi:hypothetical protein
VEAGGRPGAGVRPDVHAVFDLLDPLDHNAGQVRTGHQGLIDKCR